MILDEILKKRKDARPMVEIELESEEEAKEEAPEVKKGMPKGLKLAIITKLKKKKAVDE